MSVTLIAEKAGVSIATVSRVLNNSRPVDPTIAERVRRVAKELQLPVRTPRRSLRIRRAEQQVTIAIVSIGQSYRGWFEVPIIASVVAEMSRAASELHMGVLMTEMPDPRQVSPVLRRQEVSGALVFVNNGLTTAKDLAHLRQHLPVVRVMGDQMGPSDVDHVGPDNNAVGYIAASHLIDQGIAELAFLSMSPAWDISRLRAQGFIAACEIAGIRPKIYLLGTPETPVGLFGPDPVLDARMETLIDHLATRRRGRVGLFVSRDEETVQVYRLLRDRGLEPGRDVVVVSCDNEQVRLSMLHPRPASIDLGAAEVAHRAVQRLARRIKHRNESPIRILAMPKLVLGA